MIIARELVDELKKIKDFDITYKSDDNNSGELNIIDDEYITTEDRKYGPPAGCYWFDYAEDEFLEVFFNIVRYSLPDFEWTSRDLEEDTLYLLEGAAYGFAYHGE